MTDRYERIRAALEMGPTPGPWVQDGDGVSAADEDVAVAMCCPSDAEAAFIAACDPDTIRALLAERDALAAALDQQPAGVDEAMVERMVEAFLASTGQQHSVTQLQRDLTTKCMKAALAAQQQGGRDHD